MRCLFYKLSSQCRRRRRLQLQTITRSAVGDAILTLHLIIDRMDGRTDGQPDSAHLLMILTRGEAWNHQMLTTIPGMNGDGTYVDAGCLLLNGLERLLFVDSELF